MIKKLQLAAIAALTSVSAMAQINVMPPNSFVGIGTTKPQSNLHIRFETDGGDLFSGLRFDPATSATTGIRSYHIITGIRKNGLWICGSSYAGTYARSNMWFKDDGIRFGFSDAERNPEYYQSLFIANTDLTVPWVIDSYSGDPCLHSANSFGVLGRPEARLFRIYSAHIDANQIWTGTVQVTSDERKKENIHPLSGSLQRLSKVKAYNYDLKKDDSTTVSVSAASQPATMALSKKATTKDAVINDTATKQSKFVDSVTAVRRQKNEASRKNKIGFMAQELKTVFPELVAYDEEKDLYAVDYIGMIPVLLESIKEQQAQITAQQAQIDKMSKLIDKLKR